MTDGVFAAVLKINGRVQGVYYRASAQEEARELNLKGWAKNLADGSVEVYVEGNKTHIEEMIEWCGAGPPAAKVERVNVDWVEPENCASFDIAH